MAKAIFWGLTTGTDCFRRMVLGDSEMNCLALLGGGEYFSSSNVPIFILIRPFNYNHIGGV